MSGLISISSCDKDRQQDAELKMEAVYTSGISTVYCVCVHITVHVSFPGISVKYSYSHFHLYRSIKAVRRIF